ncbi:MAG: ribbon-helix-helix protein, CopG family [Proteobacteria bacterium]|nr:ribbon-helix-helix protein, CopG family [Pseudomonadota bacterium]
MKTDRVTLLISPDDKRQLQSLAEDRGVTASELVRQAVQAYGASSIDETRELAALTAELRGAIPAMRKSLRDANTTAERTIAALGDRTQFKIAEAPARYRAGKRRAR